MNIIELIESRLDDRFTNAAASETGLSTEQTRTTTRAAIPALLAGLLSSISKPGGSKALGSVLKDPNLLGNLSSMFTGSDGRSIAGTGINALTSVLGEGKLSSLVGALGNSSGISQGQSRSLIGMLFPVVMGVLGRDQRGEPASADGIARLLQGQKREIADALPANMASSMRSTGLLDGLDEEPRRPRQAASASTTAGTPHHAAGTQRPVQKKRNWFWPVAAGLAALALAVWGVTQLGDDEPDRQIAADQSGDNTELAAVAPSDAELRVGNVDLRQELTGVVDQASESLRGVTDEASARAALPTLSGLNDDLDNLTPMVDRLPEPARNAFADVARNGYRPLQGEIDRIESTPAIPDNVKQVARQLGDKVESFFMRGRG